jgi:hypothetical protein
LKKLDGFSFHIGLRPTQIRTSPNQADDGRPSLSPQDHIEQRVAAELRTADDELMTTQDVVGSGLISYEPDIVDQYFALTTMAVLKARFQRQSEAKSLLPRCALRPLQRASNLSSRRLLSSERL